MIERLAFSVWVVTLAWFPSGAVRAMCVNADRKPCDPSEAPLLFRAAFLVSRVWFWLLLVAVIFGGTR